MSNMVVGVDLLAQGILDEGGAVFVRKGLRESGFECEYYGKGKIECGNVTDEKCAEYRFMDFKLCPAYRGSRR